MPAERAATRRRAWWVIGLSAVGVAALIAAGTFVFAARLGGFDAEPERGWVVFGALVGVLAGLSVALVGGVLVHGYETRLGHLADEADETSAIRATAQLQSRAAVILGLAKLAESRDDSTGQHLDRIRSYVRLLGEALLEAHPEVDREFVETIVETSALHDIGKVGIPDHVLLKPGLLDDDQREIIKKHTIIGGDTLLAVKRRWGDDQFLVTACEIAFAHHERYDGTGYPFGLSGEVIPLAARIVAVADVYDALTNARTYKDAMEHATAVRIIDEGRGSHFDPVIVDAFHRCAADFDRVRLEFESREPGPLLQGAMAANDLHVRD